MLVPLAVGAAGKAPPQATITSGPSGTVFSSSATFTFTSDDPAATFACGLDGGQWADCGSPYGYSGLADGPHSFRVRAISSDGKWGPPDGRDWTVSPPPPPPPPPPPVAPETEITAGPPPSTTSTSATFSFIGSFAGASFVCSLDGGVFQACASPATYGGLSLGSHSFAVQAIRSGGTTDPTPATWSWIVTLPPDTTPPDTTIVAGPQGAVGIASAAFSFSASEAGAKFECSLDAAPYAKCTSPAGYAALAPGSHVFAVRATDSAGNVDPTPATRSWVVALDSEPSTTPAAAAPAPKPSDGLPATADFTPPGDVQSVTATSGNRLITLRWRAPEDSDFARVVVARSEDGSTDMVDVYRGDAATFVDRRVRNGTTYRYLLVTYDRAGNRSDGVRASAMPRASALRLPAPGARVTAPPRLEWTALRGANFYNVQLFRGTHKVLSAWPRRARMQLTSTWRYRGRTYRLTPGDYRWYVWPGLGRRSKARYGPLLGDSRFVVERRPTVRETDSP